MQTKTARFSTGDKIGLAGIVVAIVLPIILYWISIRGKEISYEIVANAPILSVKEIPDTRLRLSFDGQEVDDVSLVILKVINTGDEPIVVTDYQRPMEFAFGSDADILSAEVLSTVPAGIPISITHSSENLSLLPTLLNKDDVIELRVLVSNPETITFLCRIAGVKECNLTKSEGRTSILMILTVWLPLIVCMQILVLNAVKIIFARPAVVEAILKGSKWSLIRALIKKDDDVS